jgi:hypothetical protein
VNTRRQPLVVSNTTTTLSVRIDKHTKARLAVPAKRGRRSKSFPAAEAIAAFVGAESSQLDEIQIIPVALSSRIDPASL